MLELKNITKEYPAGGGVVNALRGVSLQFRKSEFVAILGPSGCGKTTMLNIIGGLDQYTDGDLVINGTSTKNFKDRDWDAYRNYSIGFVFQSYNLIPHQTVLQNVELALTLSGVSKQERRQRAREALEKVGLGDQLHKRPNQMSGGQMQRVAIARAIVNDPDIILADEPTGALDSETSLQVMDILKEIAQERLVIMVTHNPDLAEQYATRIVRVLDGVITHDSAPLTEEEFAQQNDGVVKAFDSAKKPSMSFATAFSLSLNNLLTKKGRTILTSFAGSIGIIGIALILSLSTGINTYINQVQEDTLSSYPITIEAETVDMSSMMASFMGEHQEKLEDVERADDRVYSSTVMFDMMDAMMNAETETNNLKAMKVWLDEEGNPIADMATVRYGYDVAFDVYTEDEDGNIVKSDVMTMMETAITTMYGGDYSSYFATMGSMYESMDVWQELLEGENGELIADQVKNQYDIVYGNWPENYDEVVLFINSNNEVSDLMLYALGYIADDDMADVLERAMNGENIDAEIHSWSYEELCDTNFKLILPAEYYQKDAGAKTYTDMSLTDAGMDYLYNSKDVGTTLKVVGIARPSEESTSGMVTGAIGYTGALTRYAIETTESKDIVAEQMAEETVDVFNGLPFRTEDYVEPTAAEKQEDVAEYLPTLTDAEKADAYVDVMSQASDEYVDGIVSQQMEGMTREAIEQLIVEQYAGEIGIDAETISGYIADMSDEELFSQMEDAIAASVREQYAKSVQTSMNAVSQSQLAAMLDAIVTEDARTMAFARLSPFTEEQYVYLYDNYMPPVVSDSDYEKNLDRLGYVDMANPSTISIYATTFAEKDEIAVLIEEYNAGVSEEDQISYTDYVALLMSSITGIISGISYLLIAFVSISLIVSSIMIGVITLISVQERTKEIGILRAVGASKKNVSTLFNAETLIVGLGAGAVGIITTLILIVPINAILYHYTGLEGLKAALPAVGGIALVAISALLTLISGIIPSRSAAKKDPVVALRTE